jgi:hypothetical protein
MYVSEVTLGPLRITPVTEATNARKNVGDAISRTTSATSRQRRRRDADAEAEEAADGANGVFKFFAPSEDPFGNVGTKPALILGAL